jgi:lipopolysaccharide/colanic/teichoic acid biosynthesis glycosyltransferase
MDFICAAILLVLTSPLILLISLLVKLTSRGPVFYSQVRAGQGGRPFVLYKIRTMVHNCEKVSGARWSTPGDPRITRLGRFLRASHLDELPQLWNVLRGEMSLVGPRPERPEFIPQLEQAIPHYSHRLQVRPGITGLAQVQLPPDTDLESVRRKLACDVYYVQRLTLWLDLRLLFLTALGMLGLPGTLLRRVFQIPGGEKVEQVYQSLQTRLPEGTFPLADSSIAAPHRVPDADEQLTSETLGFDILKTVHDSGVLPEAI